MKKPLSLILVFVMITMLVSTAFAENHESAITQTSDTEDATDTEQKPKWWCIILDEFCYVVSLATSIDGKPSHDYIYNGLDNILRMVRELLRGDDGYTIYNMSDEEAYFKMQEFIFLIEPRKLNHIILILFMRFAEKKLTITVTTLKRLGTSLQAL